MREMNDEHRKLVIDNYNLIYDVLRSIPHQSDYEDDLEQTAAEYLCKAAMNYDPSHGVKFSTYAYSCIRGGILSYLSTSIFVIKPSQAVIDKREEYKYSMVSLDSPALIRDEESERTLGEGIEDPTNPYEQFYNSLEQIYELIDKTNYSDKSKAILKRYYYRVCNGMEYTAISLAREFGVTRAWAHKLIQIMNEKLKTEYKKFL